MTRSSTHPVHQHGGLDARQQDSDLIHCRRHQSTFSSGGIANGQRSRALREGRSLRTYLIQPETKGTTGGVRSAVRRMSAIHAGLRSLAGEAATLPPHEFKPRSGEPMSHRPCDTATERAGLVAATGHAAPGVEAALLSASYGNSAGLIFSVAACVASAAALIFERIATGSNA